MAERYITLVMPTTVWTQIRQELDYIKRPDPNLKADKEAAAERILAMLIDSKDIV